MPNAFYAIYSIEIYRTGVVRGKKTVNDRKLKEIRNVGENLQMVS